MTDLRERVQAAKPGRRGRRKVWVPPEREDFRPGLTLNFDQSLGKTGWSLLRVIHVRDETRLEVLCCGVIEVPASALARLSGFEATFEKDLRMEEGIERVFRDHTQLLCDAVVHEMPSVKGYRLESSLMAAATVRRVARRYGLQHKVVMVNRQAAYSALVGQSALEKKYGTTTVNRLLYAHHGQRWTQDIHDSVLLGLKHLHNPREGR